MVYEWIKNLGLDGVAQDVVAGLLGEEVKEKLDQLGIKRDMREAVFVAFAEDLTRHALDDEEARENPEAWKKSMKDFLKDRVVQQELFRPFTEPAKELRLNEKSLRGRWRATVGEDTLGTRDWRRILEKYVQTARQRMLLDPDLASRLNTILTTGGRSAVNSPSGIHLEQYLQAYSALRQYLELSPLGSEDIETGEQPIAVTDVYFPGNVTPGIPKKDVPREYLRRIGVIESDAEDAPDNRLAEPLLPQQSVVSATLLGFDTDSKDNAHPLRECIGNRNTRKFVLLGDPGAGKSMAVRDIMLNCLRRLIEGDDLQAPEWQRPFEGALPVDIELRHYAQCREDGHASCFLSYLGYISLTRNYGITESGLRTWLDDRPLLLLLDGLDEVLDSNRRREIIDETVSFASAHANVRVILTSRIHGYVPDRLGNAGFAHLTLQELTPEERVEFVQRWFGHAYSDPEIAGDRFRRVQAALENSKALSSICGNPLLLTMACLVARHRELPRDRWGLFESMMKTLVYRWDHNRMGTIEVSPDLVMGEDDKLDLLTEIAKSMALDERQLSTNVILEADLETLVQEWLERERYLPPARARAAVSELIDQLRQRNFVLCLQGPQLWGFMHRTFLEWSIARGFVHEFTETKELTEEKLYGLAIERWNAPHWQEVLRLIAGRLNYIFAGPFIEKVIDSNLNDMSAMNFAAELLAERTDLKRVHNTGLRLRDAMLAIEVPSREFVNTISSFTRLPKSAFAEPYDWDAVEETLTIKHHGMTISRIFESPDDIRHTKYLTDKTVRNPHYKSSWIFMHYGDSALSNAIINAESPDLRSACIDTTHVLFEESEILSALIQSSEEDTDESVRQKASEKLLANAYIISIVGERLPDIEDFSLIIYKKSAKIILSSDSEADHSMNFYAGMVDFLIIKGFLPLMHLEKAIESLKKSSARDDGSDSYLRPNALCRALSISGSGYPPYHSEGTVISSVDLPEDSKKREERLTAFKFLQEKGWPISVSEEVLAEEASATD